MLSLNTVLLAAGIVAAVFGLRLQLAVPFWPRRAAPPEPEPGTGDQPAAAARPEEPLDRLLGAPTGQFDDPGGYTFDLGDLQ